MWVQVTLKWICLKGQMKMNLQVKGNFEEVISKGHYRHLPLKSFWRQQAHHYQAQLSLYQSKIKINYNLKLS